MNYEEYIEMYSLLFFAFYGTEVDFNTNSTNNYNLFCQQAVKKFFPQNFYELQISDGPSNVVWTNANL